MILLTEEEQKPVATEEEEGRTDPVLDWIEENFGRDDGTMKNKPRK